jgi:hypothetical protein
LVLGESLQHLPNAAVLEHLPRVGGDLDEEAERGDDTCQVGHVRIPQRAAKHGDQLLTVHVAKAPLAKE